MAQSTDSMQHGGRTYSSKLNNQENDDLMRQREGELPKDFHQRVLDLEIQMQVKPDSEDQSTVKKISELMGLYSAAIEYYNKTQDDNRQQYYVDKLQKLNDEIRSIVERQSRYMDRQNKRKALEEKKKAEDAAKPRKSGGERGRKSFRADSPEERKSGNLQVDEDGNSYNPMTNSGRERHQSVGPKLSKQEIGRMKDVIALNLHNEKIKNEKEGTKEKVIEGTLRRQEEASKVVDNDLLRQKEKMKERLAARKSKKNKNL